MISAKSFFVVEKNNQSDILIIHKTSKKTMFSKQIFLPLIIALALSAPVSADTYCNGNTNVDDCLNTCACAWWSDGVNDTSTGDSICINKNDYAQYSGGEIQYSNCDANFTLSFVTLGIPIGAVIILGCYCGIGYYIYSKRQRQRDRSSYPIFYASSPPNGYIRYSHRGYSQSEYSQPPYGTNSMV